MTSKFLIILIFISGVLLATEREDVIDNWLNSDISNEEFISLTLNDIKKIEGKTYSDYISLSILNMNIGQAWLNLENKEKSLEYLELSQEQAAKSLEIKETSEGWRLLADTGSFIMLQKGVAYIIQNSGKVQENALKALELDKSNARAALVDAQGLVNAPRIFGGNKKKGLEILTDLTNRTGLSKEDAFYMKIALGEALISNKNKELAKDILLDALKLYPNNKRANELLDSL